MTSVGTRREARERAVELLYEADAKSIHPDEVIAALPIRPDDYAVELATGVADHMIEIDSVLERYASRWPVARMAAMDRMVLRLGVFELATQASVPTGVCLSEAVELGSRYGSTDDTSRFVNGVLAAVATEIRDGDRPWTPIDTVVFDMDGVFRVWSGDVVAAFEAAHGLRTGSVSDVAFAQPIFDEAMLGRLTAEEWALQIASRLVDQEPSLDAQLVIDMWLAADWTIDPAMVELLRELRQTGVRTALFSNASTNLEVDLDRIGLTGDFDVIANSSRLGLMKPDVAGFDRVAAMIGAAPERLLFVDDKHENVLGAVSSGWHAVQMRGAAPFRKVLRRLGVLPDSFAS